HLPVQRRSRLQHRPGPRRNRRPAHGLIEEDSTGAASDFDTSAEAVPVPFTSTANIYGEEMLVLDLRDPSHSVRNPAPDG
ncbi:MAG: hypothetical protein ACRD40_18490, partial [Candidatus Acidiferrales bacterium]